jgi:hypothetical protein
MFSFVKRLFFPDNGSLADVNVKVPEGAVQANVHPDAVQMKNRLSAKVHLQNIIIIDTGGLIIGPIVFGFGILFFIDKNSYLLYNLNWVYVIAAFTFTAYFAWVANKWHKMKQYTITESDISRGMFELIQEEKVLKVICRLMLVSWKCLQTKI